MKKVMQSHVFSAGKIIGDELFFSERRFNGLFRYNLSSKEVAFESFFLGEDVLKGELHKKCFAYGNKLFFLPEAASGIHVYDMGTKEQVCLPFSLESKGELGFYSEAIQREEVLWIFPLNDKQPLIELDMRELKLELFEDFTTECTQYLGKDRDIFFTRACLYGNSVFLCGYDTNIVLEWNTNTRQIIKHEVSMNHLFGIFQARGKMWMTNLSDGDILSWLPNQYEERFAVNVGCEMGRAYNHIIELADNIVVVPAFSEDILILDEELHSFVKKIKYPKEVLFDTYGMKIRFFGYESLDNALYLFPFGANGLIKMDAVTMKLSFSEMELQYWEITKEPFYSLCAEHLKQHVQQGSVGEGEFLSLPFFLEVEKSIEVSGKDKNTLCGKNIWMNVVKNEIIV